MNNIKHIRKRSIGTLVVLLFVLNFAFTPALLFSDLNFGPGPKKFTDEESLNLSTNYLFKGTTYTFNLDDFYDDEDLYKIYTGAKFQTEAFNGTTLEWSGTINNNTVTPVDNDETQYGDPNNINMIKGTTDSVDNMKVNDASYTTFTSTHTDGYIYETPSQWDNFTFTEGTGDTIGEIETIDADYSTLISTEDIVAPDEYITSMDYTHGYHYSGTLANIRIDDLAYYYAYGHNVEGTYIIDVEFLFDEALNGRDFLISTNLACSTTSVNELRINDVMWKDTRFMDFDDELAEDVTKISLYVSRPQSNAYMKMYYFKIVDVDGGTPAELDVQVDIQVDNPDLSSIEYFKFSHKTNISATMDLDIWNWDTSTWYEIESIDNSANFDDDYYILGVDSDYVNSSFGVRIRFQASSSSSDFALLIDRLRLDYLTTPAELEMTITFLFAKYNKDLLAMTIQSWQRTNKTQTINFSIWNYDTESYTQISSSSDTTFTKKEYNTESPSNFISSSGVVKLYWGGSDIINDFELDIDYLFIQIFYKLDLVHEKSFDTNGIYRYRWCVLGSIHYTQWVVFEVIDPVPNFHAISESDVTTRWLLQGSDISAVEDFHDDISGSNWDLYGVSERLLDDSITPTHDAHTYVTFPDTNYGSSNVLGVVHSGGVRINIIFFNDPATYGYLTSNFTTNSTGKFYMNRADATSINLKLYSTFSFDENTITYNNMPATYTFLSANALSSGVGWKYIDLGANHSVNYFRAQLDAFSWQQYSAVEGAYDPQIIHHISKNYQGGGMMYMQTNITESISLRSEVYGTHYTLSSGDYFEVDFQTNSDSLINLILLKDGVVNNTLTLSKSRNTNFNRHTIQIPVDEVVEFDQLKISSTFEDTDNIKVYDIKTKKYTLTNDLKEFYISPNNQRDVYLTPDDYNLRIYECGDPEIKIDEDITIGSTDYYKIYTPTETILCRLTLFSLAEEYLQFEDYHVKVNRSLNEQYGQIDLVDTLFYADDETNVYIEVYDRFDALIYDDFEFAKTYLDLYIEVYSLKIRNEATEIVDYTLQNTDTGSSKPGILFSDEIVEYHVTSGNYSLDYTNYEDMYPREYNFELITHKTISINSTYNTIYFGLFTYDGLGINRDWVRFYINSVRKDFGFNVIDSETANLIVLDFFNNTLANETIDTSAYSEYNIFIEIYSMIILNQFTYEDIVVNITQVGSGIWMVQIIPKQFGLNYRFLPNVEYNITIYFTNMTFYDSRIVNLTDNNHIESFGVPTQPPEYPKNVYFGVYTSTGLGIDHNLLKFYIDGNRNDFGFNRIEDMMVTLLVKDYFNTTLFNQVINTSGIYEYNILITLYSLQIKNLQIQETTIDVNSTLYKGTLLSEESLYFMLAEDYYEIGYYDTNNVYKQFLIYLDSNQAYELNRSQICILIYADQQGDHIVFETYKTYLNGSRVYTNNFYREIGDVVGIEIKDRYDISIKNDTLIVVSGVNEKYIVLTLYSLKIMNQQLDFNHINITRDPNYYESSMYWSKWIAPSEIIEFNLFAGYYKINLTNSEDETYSYYAYTLKGDDILLIGSNNTIYNVLVNIANVNATIGNQITNVQIDITNQNSQINNSIINIDINLGNINSTLGDMLINLDLDITNIANNISTLYVFTENSFVNLGNDINVSFISIENNIISINQTISNLVIGVSNDIYLINGTISTMITQLETNLLLMNVSIDTALFGLNTTLNLIDSNITSNFISINNSIYLNNLNINDSRIAIINNLLLINNTISSLIADVYSAVYLINNSIYTAVVDMGTYLSLMNNTISGNLSIILEMNDFLTELYVRTMFSELLNWTDIGFNITLLISQTDMWTFVNNYRNQSVEVHLRYQGLIKKLVISADDSKDQWLPYDGVEYREWSVEDEEYIGKWKELDSDEKTIDFGFFETDVPYDPEPLMFDTMTLIAFVIIISVVGWIIVFAWSYMKRDRDKTPKKVRRMYKEKELRPGTFEKVGI